MVGRGLRRGGAPRGVLVEPVHRCGPHLRRPALTDRARIVRSMPARARAARGTRSGGRPAARRRPRDMAEGHAGVLVVGTGARGLIGDTGRRRARTTSGPCPRRSATDAAGAPLCRRCAARRRLRTRTGSTTCPCPARSRTARGRRGRRAAGRRSGRRLRSARLCAWAAGDELTATTAWVTSKCGDEKATATLRWSVIEN